MARDERPNILVIMSDQHNKHVLGCYGDGIVRTPNLDALAAEGMRFTGAYCPSPLCVPSRSSFMTSRTPSRNRVWDNNQVLHSGIPTWAHVLGAAGYETALSGRMHFNGPDQRHGFEKRPAGEFHSRHLGAAPLGGPMWTKFPGAVTGQSRVAVETAGRGRTHYQWFDDQAVEAACRYLREKAAAPGGRPFAAVVGLMLPHCPFVAPRELFDYYHDRVDIPPVEADQPATITRFRRLRGLIDPCLPEQRIRVARAAYFGLCEYTDRLVGQVLETLDETGLADNTLVIYTTDHGDMAGEHGCWWKSSYYEGSASVPLIARLPGAVPAGSVCQAVCNLMDLGPTFAEVAAAQFPTPVDGRSLWPTLRGRHPADWSDQTFSELIDPKHDRMLTSRMVRSGPWKLWTFADEDDLPPTLFNLDQDPGELHDLAGDPGYAGVRDELLRKVFAAWDPQAALAEAKAQFADFIALKDWGAAVQPRHEDEVAVPPADYEADVELL